MSMNLYYWRSQALKQYGRGHIIAMATDIEAARASARTQYDAYLRSAYEYLFSDPTDQDDLATITEYRQRFETDLAGTPEILGVNTSASLVIAGSD